jgi:YVTN family beta-propeller protein
MKGSNPLLILIGLLAINIMYILFMIPLFPSAISDEVIGTIKLDSSPTDLMYNQANENVYVNTESGVVSVIDSKSNNVVGNITIGRIPSDIAFSEVSGNMYVTNSISDVVSVIDSKSNNVVGNISMDSPTSITYNKANGNLYVVHDLFDDNDYISVIDSKSNNVVGNITVAKADFNPFTEGPTKLGKIAYNDANGNIYAIVSPPNMVSDVILSIDGKTNKILGNITIFDPLEGSSLLDLGFNDENGNLFVTNSLNENVTIVDTNANVILNNVTVGYDPSGIAYNPNSHNMYIVSYGSGTVTVVDGMSHSIIENIFVNGAGGKPVYNPSNNALYILDNANSEVHILGQNNNTQVGSHDLKN